MSVLLSLPDDLVRFICCSWLRLKEWQVLDLIINHVEQQSRFRSLLSTFVSNCTPVKRQYDWIKLRNIKLTSLTSEMMSLNFDLSEVESISTTYSGEGVETVANACPKLKSILTGNFFNFDLLSPAILCNLTDLHCHEHEFPLTMISQHCRSLKKLVINNRHREVIQDSSHFVPIFENNPLLTWVNIDTYILTNEVIASMCNNCTRIIELCFIDSNLDLHPIVTHCRNNKMIRLCIDYWLTFAIDMLRVWNEMTPDKLNIIKAVGASANLSWVTFSGVNISIHDLDEVLNNSVLTLTSIECSECALLTQEELMELLRRKYKGVESGIRWW